jgi:hypothetical protein
MCLKVKVASVRAPGRPIDTPIRFSYTDRMNHLVIFAAVLIVAGCTRPGGSGSVMSEKQFAHVYAALLDAGQRSRDEAWDPGRTRLTADSVLHAAGVTREDYRATVAWLNEDVTRWKAVSEETVRVLEEKAAGGGVRATPRSQ